MRYLSPAPWRVCYGTKEALFIEVELAKDHVLEIPVSAINKAVKNFKS